MEGTRGCCAEGTLLAAGIPDLPLVAQEALGSPLLRSQSLVIRGKGRSLIVAHPVKQKRGLHTLRGE